MGRKRQDRSEQPRHTVTLRVHLPEVRPESNAYRIASKTKFSGEAVSKKITEDKTAAYQNTNNAQEQSAQTNAFLSDNSGAVTRSNAHTSKAEKQSSANRSYGAEKDIPKDDPSASESSDNSTKKAKAAAKAAALNDYQSRKNTAAPSGENSDIRAKAEALQQRLQANAELARHENFSDRSNNSAKSERYEKSDIGAANYRVQSAKSEYIKLNREARQSGKVLAKEEHKAERIDKQLTKTEKLIRADKAGFLESVIDKGQKVATVYTEAAAAASKDTVGEASAAMAAVPAKLIGREIISKARDGLKRDFHKKYVVKQKKKIGSLESRKKEIIKRLKEEALTPEEIKKESKDIKRINKRQEKLRKSLDKKSGGEKALDGAAAVVQAAGKISSEIESADSTGEAAVNAVTALPKQLIKDKAVKTVSEISHNMHRKQLEAKRERLKAQRAKVEKRAENIRKEHVAREMKVNVYKSAHGIASKTATGVQNAQAAIKAAGQVIAKAAQTVQSAGAAIAAMSSMLPVIIVIIVIIILIIILFSWLQPHTEEQYDPGTNSWKEVLVDGDDKALLQGYIKHISDYFDKKQLEILEVVDINFGGFAPDRYNYAREDDRNGVLNFSEMRNISCEQTDMYFGGTLTFSHITGWNPGNRYNPGGSPIYSETTVPVKSNAVFRKEYYKTDEELGYEVRCASNEAESEAVYTNITIDIQGYYDYQYTSDMAQWNANKSRPKPAKYTFKNGTLCSGANLSEITVTRYKDGIFDESMPAFEYAKKFLSEHSELLTFMSAISEASSSEVVIPNNAKDVRYNVSLVSENKEMEMEDKQYIFQNYIWSLNEYQNRWIKLTDECDYEHIIAMAAIKKFQDITATGFDDQNYTFTITDEDLDECLDEMYEFSYSYSVGPCRNLDCYKYYLPGGGFAYKCGNYSHKHLIGNVVNYQAVGGIDMILNRILNKNTEVSLEDKKSIYEVYAEYIYGVLGTSTKLPDYENDREAQERLLHMHEAEHGKKPGNPVKNPKCTNVRVREVPTGSAPLIREEHYILNLSWNAPDPEEYSEGKFTEITGYRVCEYNRSAGTVKELARVNGTSCEVDVGTGGGVKWVELPREEWGAYYATFRGEVSPSYTYIFIQPYNGSGEGPRSQNIYVKLDR